MRLPKIIRLNQNFLNILLLHTIPQVNFIPSFCMIKLFGLRRSLNLTSLKHRHFSTQDQILLYDKFKGFQNIALNNLQIPGVTIANTREKAMHALEVLKSIDDRYGLLLF